MDNQNQNLYQYPQQPDGQQAPPIPPQSPQYAPQPFVEQPASALQTQNYLAPQQAAQEPKRRPPIVLIAIISTALLAALAIGSYVMIANRKTIQKVAPSTTKEAVTTPLTAGMTIEYARGYFSGTGSATTSLTTPVTTKDHNYLTIIADPQQVAKTSLAGTLPFKDATAALVALRKALGDQRYSETVITDGTSGTNFLADYNRSDVTCQIYAEKPQDGTAAQYLEVKCLDQKQYEVLAETQETFYKAYSAASASSASSVFIGAPVITPSATAGYQLAEQKTATASTHHVVTAGPTIKLYAAADNVWHYFTDSSSVLACTTYYKKPATTAAYVNTPCLNDKNQTVKVILKKS